MKKLSTVCSEASSFRFIAMLGKAVDENADKEMRPRQAQELLRTETFRMTDIYGERFSVNSAHHQAIDKIGRGFEVALLFVEICCRIMLNL